MAILCSIFGHKKPEGYAGRPYLSDFAGLTPDFENPWRDGTGRGHVQLYALCPRCRKRYYYASVHTTNPKGDQ